MSRAVDFLRSWFEGLPRDDQREVVRFLYDGKAILEEGVYLGPRPGLVTKGLFVGPAPSSSGSVCQACGRPL